MNLKKAVSALALVQLLSGAGALASFDHEFGDLQFDEEMGATTVEVYSGREDGTRRVVCRLSVLRHEESGRILAVKALTYAKQIPIAIALVQEQGAEIEGSIVYDDYSSHLVRVVLKNNLPVAYVFSSIFDGHVRWPIEKRCIGLTPLPVQN